MSLVVDQEPDHVPRRVLLQSTAVVVVAVIASILAALWLARSQVGEELTPASTEVPQPLDATLFDLMTPAELARRSAGIHLTSYGWVDKARGIIHVPIAVATERYLSEAR
jgi:hypothetical protein